MGHNIEDYTGIVGDKAMYDIHCAARRLYSRSVVHVNSTYYGGGVAEILSALVPLMNDVGVAAGWRQLRGSPDFFNVTKKFHNALQGDVLNLTDMKKKLYVQTNVEFSTYTHLQNHNCIIVHDPQPLPMIRFYRKHQPWIWRIHIDMSHPDEKLWEFLKNYVLRYDVVIVSHEKYKRKDLHVEQRVFHPAIDPLSSKNIELGEKTINKFLKKFNVPDDKPILCQISRFDKWKDPEGVVEVYKRVKEKVDCRLVLCGSTAVDDPESYQVFTRLQRRTNSMNKNGDVILITSENNVLVNALQRRADVIIQKSLREGFGLTVTEALWKETPVVASKVGGITLQIEDGKTGYLVDPQDTDGFSDRIVTLLKDKALAQDMGKKAKESVREKFLITRLLLDYLELIHELLQ